MPSLQSADDEHVLLSSGHRSRLCRLPPVTYNPPPNIQSGGISIFWIFIFIIYFVIGIVYNVAVKKEKGLRMLPNYDFLTNVPSYMSSAVNRLSSATSSQQAAASQPKTENWNGYLLTNSFLILIIYLFLLLLLFFPHSIRFFLTSLQFIFELNLSLVSFSIFFLTLDFLSLDSFSICLAMIISKEFS